MMNQKLFVTAASGDSAAPLTEGVEVSSTTTYYSRMISGKDTDTFALHIEWSGTPTGTLTLWVSDKPNPDESSDTDWVQDTGWAPTNPAGAASKFHSEFTAHSSHRKRVKYVNTSGTGTLKGWASVPNN